MPICGVIASEGVQPSPGRCCLPLYLFCKTLSSLHSCHLQIPTNLTEVTMTFKSAIIPPAGSWDSPGYQHCGFVLGTATRTIKERLHRAPHPTALQALLAAGGYAVPRLLRARGDECCPGAEKHHRTGLWLPQLLWQTFPDLLIAFLELFLAPTPSCCQGKFPAPLTTPSQVAP